MSNKIVPSIYRTVIDDVIASVKSDFQVAGIEGKVLADLQHRWEDKVLESRVAYFGTAVPNIQSPVAPQMMHSYLPPQLPPAPHSPTIIGDPLPFLPNIDWASPIPSTMALTSPPGCSKGSIPQIDGSSDESPQIRPHRQASTTVRVSAPCDTDAIGSDLDDSDSDDDGPDDSHHVNTAFCASDKQVEMRLKKWHRTCKRKGLPLLKVYWVLECTAYNFDPNVFSEMTIILGFGRT
ncbi:hypothetical protein B0H14DRAFT_3162417 [Mycena olivaceomarginata]|nr:hypothetical protein B0H14DRAFT_3162417 [Mycena olivaceomarginata]